MPQQCSSVSRCIRKRIIMEEHYTRCQHSTFSVLSNRSYEALYQFAIHFWRHCGPLSHELHHQNSFPVPGNSCHLLSGRQTEFALTASACLMDACATIASDCYLGSIFRNETQVSTPVNYMMSFRHTYIAIAVVSFKNSKAYIIFCVLCTPLSISGTHLARNL
jgi:hypothetical protein